MALRRSNECSLQDGQPVSLRPRIAALLDWQRIIDARPGKSEMSDFVNCWISYVLQEMTQVFTQTGYRP